MLSSKKAVKYLLVYLLIVTFLSSMSVCVLFLPAASEDLNANLTASLSSTWFYTGWQYRKAHDITNNQPASVYNFYSLSSAVNTIVGNPSPQHAFQPVHNNTIQEVYKTVDGNVWKYLGYDCDPSGSKINLFYTNDTGGTWTPYSGNPILGVKAYYYRWPSTTYLNGTFHMFLEDYTGGTLERWTSTDGITYTFLENVKSGGNQYKNPFIWLNPNDNKWYLYSHDSSGSTENFKVRNATSITGLRTATDTIVLSRNLPFGSPTIMYYAGLYWLLGEIYTSNVWQIVAYYSTSPSSGFVQASNSPILVNDVACPMVFLMPNQIRALLYTTVNSAVWNQMTQEINLNSSITPTKIDLSDYQIKLNVYYANGTSSTDSVYLAGHCKTDFTDIRFTWFNSTVNSEFECHYWIETSTVGTSAVFWVKVPQILGSSNSTIYIYYGNKDVSTTSNGTATFEFFDDFSGNLSKWTAVGGSWQIQNGELVSSITSFGQRLRANNFVFANNSVHFKAQWTAGTYFEAAACIRGQSPNEQNNGYMTYLSTWSLANRERISKMYNAVETTLASQGTTNPSLNVWYTYVFSAYGTSLKSTITPFYQYPINATDATFGTGTFCLLGWSAASETIRYDNVFITKYYNPEPIQGNWYVEETGYVGPPPPSVIVDDYFVSDARADIQSNQTIGFHAQWSNGSSINSGSIYINGTQCEINATGWATLNVTSPPLYKEVPVTKPIQASYIANDGTVYAGSGQTLYQSVDQGVSWRPLLTFNGSNPTQLECVFVSRSGYVFTSPNASASASDIGLWRSSDAGQTWTRVLQLPTNCNIWTMAEDSNGTLFAGVYTFGFSISNARIYRSLDNGTSWDTVYYDSSARHIHCVYVDSSTSYVYGIVGDDVSPWNIHYVVRSTSSGDNGTWTKILSGMPQMTTMEAFGGARYFGTDSTGNGKLYRTTDDISYTSVLDTGNSCYCYWIRANPLNGVMYASFVSDGVSTYAAIYQSTNGSTWSLYKILPVQNLGVYLGSGSASNFNQGTLYYSVQTNSSYQNGVKIYPSYDPVKTTWTVTGVDVNGVILYTQAMSNPSIIWDQIRIGAGGLSKYYGSLGDNVTVWFTANYQYDNSVFDGAKGTLYVNNLTMQWSTVNNRWEHLYTISTVGTTMFRVSGVNDSIYGISRINDLVDGLVVSVTDQPFYIITNSTISQFAFNSTSGTLAFTVSGQSGSMGFMNLTISKTFVADISSLNVTVDDNNVNYTWSSTAYYYSILFSYYHSTHKVVVNFGGQATANPNITALASVLPEQSPQLRTQIQTPPSQTELAEPWVDLNTALLILASILLSVLILLEVKRQIRKK